MKALIIILIVVASLALVGGSGYLYASSGITSKTGYAKLGTPTGGSVDTLFSVKVGPGGLEPLKWLFAKVVDNSDHVHDIPKRLFKNVMQELQGVQLRVYDVGNNRQAFDSAIVETVASLKEKNWQTLMTVREGDERIIVLQYGNDESIEGLSVMVSSSDKAMFVNLIGPFDPKAIAETANQLN